MEMESYSRSWTWTGPIPLLILLALVVVPYWKIWSRTGHSGAWGLLMLIPLANIISLWALAFKDWPALRGGKTEPRP